MPTSKMTRDLHCKGHVSETLVTFTADAAAKERVFKTSWVGIENRARGPPDVKLAS